MKKTALLALLIALLAAFPLAAQQAVTIDYLIRNIRYSLSPDGERILVQFEVINNGATATTEVTAWLLTSDSEEEIASTEVPPLEAGESQYTVSLDFPVRRFPSGTRQSLVATIGVRDLPPISIRTRQGNIAPISVPIPEYTPDSGGASPEVTPAPESTLPFGINLDTTDPIQVALIIGVIGVALILLWLFTVILRVLFSRPPTFPNWQVPYVTNIYLDPNTTPGRRQLWQQHAQNDALPLPCQPGAFTARKRLVGVDGSKLAGWRVTAARLSQYDMYGRVQRSQTIGTQRVARTIDRAVRKTASLDHRKAQSAVTPAANRLLREFFRKINKRNMMLPIALDLRLRGAHGEVNILFELHQCVDGNWQLVDEWQPEINIGSGSIQENFTYAFFGQRQGETPRQFQQRLRADLINTLAVMVEAPPSATASATAPPSTIPAMPELPADTAPVKTVSAETRAPDEPPA